MKSKITILLGFYAIILSSCSKSDIIPPTPPKAIFAYTVGSNGSVKFSNFSSMSDSYKWSFGDGYTSLEESPTHQYGSNQTYTVTLSVTGKGGADSETQLVTVNTVKGSLLVYKAFSNGGTNIKVWVDGTYIGLINGGFYYSSAPSCGNIYSVTAYNLSTGTHTLTAKEETGLFPKNWNTTVSISSGCNTIGLK